MKTQNQLRIEVNPVYKPLLNDKTEVLLLYGGSGCFTSKQNIITSKGNKEISKINIGDKVLSYNHLAKKNEFRKVTAIHNYKVPTEKIYRIKLKNGTIIEATENHKFYYGGAYVKIKDILLSLLNGNMEKNT